MTISGLCIGYYLSELNSKRLESLNFGDIRFKEIKESLKDFDHVLVDLENLETVQGMDNEGVGIILFEPVLLNNIFQASDTLVQITSLEVLETDLLKYFDYKNIFTSKNVIYKKVCGDSYRFGRKIDDLLSICHLNKHNVFNITFTFSWLSVFFSQLAKIEAIDLPIELTVFENGKDLRLGFRSFLKEGLPETFDLSMLSDEKSKYSQSVIRLFDYANFVFFNEDKKNRIFDLDIILLGHSDVSPKVLGHCLPSLYARNQERMSFYSPYLKILSPEVEEEKDKLLLKKGHPSEKLNQSDLYDRGRLGLEEVAVAIRNQKDFYYKEYDLDKNLVRKILSSLGFNNTRITDDEVDSLINLVENHKSLDLFVEMKNKAYEQGESILNLENDLLDYIKSINEVELVNLKLLEKEDRELENFTVPSTLAVNEQDNVFVSGEAIVEDEVQKVAGKPISEDGVQKVSVGENGPGSDDVQVVSGQVEKGEVDQIRSSDFENYTLPEDSELIEAHNQQPIDNRRDIEGIRESEEEINTRIKGLKEDLTEEIIRISGRGESVTKENFRIMFLEKARKHFSVVTKVAEEAGENIFKSVVSKSIDKGLVSHDPKVFGQKIIDLSQELESRDATIKLYEAKIKDLIEDKNKDLHPDLQNLGGKPEGNLERELNRKNKVIEFLEDKIKNLEEKNTEQKMFSLSPDELKTNEELRSKLLKAEEMAQSFKALSSELSLKIKSNNSIVNELKARVNKSTLSERQSNNRVKTFESKNQNLEKEILSLNKTIDRLKREKFLSKDLNEKDETLNQKVEGKKNQNNLRMLELKNRHVENYNEKLKDNLKVVADQLQYSKKESHKHKLHIKLLEQQIKKLLKKSA